MLDRRTVLKGLAGVVVSPFAFLKRKRKGRCSTETFCECYRRKVVVTHIIVGGEIAIT